MSTRSSQLGCNAQSMKGLNGNYRTNVPRWQSPQRDPDVKMLSLGVSPQNLISKEDENKIKEYGKKHFSIRGVPDQKEMKRLALYVSNVSQSSASSLEIARKAMMTRRVEGASGSAFSEIGKRSRRQQSKKLPTKRRKQDIEA